MKTQHLVLKELIQRSNQLFTGLLAITLGIAIIVGIKNITFFSEKALSRELDALGANILILPKSATIQDYYSADFQEEEIPEDYVKILVNSDIQGLDNLSPKLNLPMEVNGYKTILTGILPGNEFKSKATWQGALGVFSRPEGCGTVSPIPGISDPKQVLSRKRVIDNLDEDRILAGSEIAAALKLKEGGTIQIKDRLFKVEAILPATGTADDNRLFTHLRTVQTLSGKTAALNAIEIVGCCSEISRGLIQKINRLLPDAKVVTITQIVQTQLNTNNIMKRLSLIMLIIIIIIGGASIANYMFANVYERRREIGILMAIGAKPAWLIKIFLLKSIYIGLAGGVIGYTLGTLLAVFLGPQLAGITVLPLPALGLYGLGLSLLISVVASILPVVKAVKIDPSVIMQEG